MMYTNRKHAAALSMCALAAMMAACDKNEDRNDNRAMDDRSDRWVAGDMFDSSEAERYALRNHNPEYGPTGMNVDAQLMSEDSREHAMHTRERDSNYRDRDMSRSDPNRRDMRDDQWKTSDKDRYARNDSANVQNAQRDRNWNDQDRTNLERAESGTQAYKRNNPDWDERQSSNRNHPNWNNRNNTDRAAAGATTTPNNQRNQNNWDDRSTSDRNMANDPNRIRDNDMDRTRNDMDRMSSDAKTMAAAYNNASPDARFLSMLHLKNQKEIEVGRLAQQKATTDEARRLGDMLVNDHTENDRKLMELAQSENIMLLKADQVKAAWAAEKNMRPDQMTDPAAELNSLSGAQFDKQFGTKMHEGHQKLIDKVQSMRGQLQNERVRAFADETLTALRKHEQMAQKVHGMATTGGDVHDHDHADHDHEHDDHDMNK